MSHPPKDLVAALKQQAHEEEEREAVVGLLNSAVFAALGYLDGLYDRGAIDAQGLEVRQELRSAVRWNADRPARTFGSYRPVTVEDVLSLRSPDAGGSVGEWLRSRVTPASVALADREAAVIEATDRPILECSSVDMHGCECGGCGL